MGLGSTVEMRSEPGPLGLVVEVGSERGPLGLAVEVKSEPASPELGTFAAPLLGPAD